MSKPTFVLRTIAVVVLVLSLGSCKSHYLSTQKSATLLDIAAEPDEQAFVNLQNYSRDFVLDMRYATPQNFLKEKVC